MRELSALDPMKAAFQPQNFLYPRGGHARSARQRPRATGNGLLRQLMSEGRITLRVTEQIEDESGVRRQATRKVVKPGPLAG